MPVQVVKANGIEVWCEDFGNPRDPALLLVMGAGGQAIHWPDDFCEALAARGRYVIRYDNRDTGQSTCFDFAACPYTLHDMALDAVGVLDAFGIERAHVVGASMGGMIAQTLAIEHPQRLLTITSVMSSPLARSATEGIFTGRGGALPGADPKVVELVLSQAAKPPRTPEERVAAAIAMWSVLAGTGEPFDEAEARAREERVFARAKSPDAANNHGLAIGASPDRTEALRGVATPTLVIHGADDPILPLAHGRATADAIPGARLLVIEGMGHDVPRGVRKRVADAIVEHTAG
jgi:pimeloyl-ACP methyl ester carboxylesterase